MKWVTRALALLLCAVVTEALLRGALMLRVRIRPPTSCGTRPELLARLIDAYSHRRPSPGEPLGGLVPDAHRGYRNAPGLRQAELADTQVSTNSRGARGTREYAIPKPPSVVRIVALGDSVTFGFGVPDEATWPAQLEAVLPGVEVVNLGEPAYAHDQMYFALRDDGMAFEPDAVILGFYDSDLGRNELTFYCSEKPRFSRTPEGWQIENLPVPLPWEVHDRYLRMPLVYALPRVLFDALAEPSLTEHSGAERAAEIFRRMRQITAQAGARFILVNLPELVASTPNLPRFLDDYCAKTGAECVDTWPLFQAAVGSDDAGELRKRYLRRDDPFHYSRAGYAVVAEALRRHLVAHPVCREGNHPIGWQR
jgi:lysophospholipase L1-like esterase